MSEVAAASRDRRRTPLPDQTKRRPARQPASIHLVGAAVALLLTASATALEHRAAFAGQVVAVQDGDTLSVMRDGRSERVRIYGIDAPETRQDFGNRAKEFLSQLVFGQMVEVEVRDIDRYGRSVGRVLRDGQDVGLAVVRAGFAWHFTRYSNDAVLATAEREARATRRGLWAQTGPVPPWEHRNPSARPLGIAGTSAVASRSYHGNLRSKVFHAPGCQHYDCPNCSATFASSAEATAAGYRPHAGCVR
jgi:micrococcal nuclease